MKRLFTITMLVIVLCSTGSIRGDIPQTMNYQGILTDASGQTVPDGTYDLTFRLYDISAGGSHLWVETQAVWVAGGNFSVILGRVIPLTLPFDRPYWLGVTIEDGDELIPRRELAASPYALSTRSVSIGDGSITTEKIANGAVTLPKINSTGASNGQAIMYDGTSITWGDPPGSGNGGGLELPYAGVASVGGTAFSIENYGNAIAAYSLASAALFGESQDDLNGAVAIYGLSSNPSQDSISLAVYGENEGTGFNAVGVCGLAMGDGVGVYGYTPGEYSIGVWGDTDIGWAGMFSGVTGVDGDLVVSGAISKGGGGFRIDHPLDPENKYLQHSFVESSDMMNMYNGNATLDANGEAWIELPEWFEAVNKDFRYQLTCIGGYAPVYIAEKISDNRFKIAGGRSGLEVSWQVTGIRQDSFAQANRIPVEKLKALEERGSYLHPEAFGLPKERGAGWARKARRLKDVRDNRDKLLERKKQ